MKYILLAFLMVLTGCASMQPVTEDELTFSAVYEAPSSRQSQIFEAAKVWIAQKFVSAKAVIEHEDKQGGVLIGNGITDYPCKGMGCTLKDEWGLAFTIRVDVKDNKFKLTFTNVKLED